MMRRENTRQVGYSILLICEGTRTEPNFFYELTHDEDKCSLPVGSVRIIPKPTIESADEQTQSDRGNNRRQRRKLGNTSDMNGDLKESNPFPGPQPLNWVRAGQENLDTFDEVWCIFDKDGHPRQKEAFELADKIKTDGKNLNIALSSRCIEYYFLLHFEYIFKAFEKSECNEKRNGKSVSFRCMTDEALPGACDGSKCVNGYARCRKYWKESKKTESLYKLLSDKLFVAFRNSEKLRRESETVVGSDTAFYERNPYIYNTDTLVARLMGYTLWSTKTPLEIKSGQTRLRLSIDSDSLVVYNAGEGAYCLTADFLSFFNVHTGKKMTVGGTSMLLSPGEVYKVRLNGSADYAYVCNFDTKKYMFFV